MGFIYGIKSKYSARQQKIAIAQLRSWPENHNFNEIAPIAVFTHAIICEKIQFPRIYGTRPLKKDA